jgi:DNA-directed RNA polymerase subunit M
LAIVNLISVTSSPFGRSKTVKMDKGRVLVMDFCPTCGSMLEIRKTKTNDDIPLIFLVCGKCGYKRQESENKISATDYKAIKHSLQQQVTVISKEDQKVSTLPTLRVECPKCSNMLVYVWQVQTRGGDEASTQFMRCTKCNHTFREYS